MSVTIGIPSYNNARWLQNAIASALAQTWPHVEVIVVDDGSTDTSLVIAAAFGEKVRLFRNQHRGANVARNTILQEATGDWIQYLDSDDYLLPDKIATQFAEGANGDDADVLYAPVKIEETVGDEVRESISGTDPASDLFAQWIAWHLPQTGGCLWRREALANLGGWRADQPCCQEHELYARALRAGLRFRYTPTPRAVYRIWSNDTLCRKDSRQVIRERTKLIDAMREWMEGRKLWTPHHREVAGRACLEMARLWAREDRAEAARYFRERQRRGLIHFAGPAAPRSYEMAVRTLGFTGAELLAQALRK